MRQVKIALSNPGGELDSRTLVLKGERWDELDSAMIKRELLNLLTHYDPSPGDTITITESETA